MAEARTPGGRLYLVRLACGDGLRNPEPMKAFAARVYTATRVAYTTNAVSLLERDKQGWGLDDVRTFAKVDPLKRGPVWLSALEEAEAPREAQPIPHEVVVRAVPKSGARKRQQGGSK